MAWLDKLLRRPQAPAPPEEERALSKTARPRGSPPERLTTLNFERFVREHPRAVVDVWAPWCGPCRAFGPVFASTAQEWGGWVGFGKLHADHEPTLVRRFKVRTIPSLLFFRNGKLVRMEVGVVPPDRFVHQMRLAFRDLPAHV